MCVVGSGRGTTVSMCLHIMPGGGGGGGGHCYFAIRGWSVAVVLLRRGKRRQRPRRQNRRWRWRRKKRRKLWRVTLVSEPHEFQFELVWWNFVGGSLWWLPTDHLGKPLTADNEPLATLMTNYSPPWWQTTSHPDEWWQTTNHSNDKPLATLMTNHAPSRWQTTNCCDDKPLATLMMNP